MKRARQERASSSSDYNGYGALSSPRRMMIPLLVRDGKTGPSAISPTSPHPISYTSSTSDLYSGSSSNSRSGVPYGEELSLYSNPGHASTMSPFSGPLAAGGFGVTYSPETSPQFPVPSPQQTRDYLTATYHHQLGSQQYGSAYGASHLRGAAAAFNSPYALSASNYSTAYPQQPKCWPTW